MAEAEPTTTAVSEETNANGTDERPFYADAAKYWAKVEPTVDGMLGGLGDLSQLDIQNSEKLLKEMSQQPNAPGNSYALDCGAGIGRITLNLLQRHFLKVDLVDQDPHFIEEATKNLAGSSRVGQFFAIGLQKFVPEEGKYDVIWVQWVLQHLTDDDLVSFLQRCKTALRPNGAIVVKENTTRTEVLDNDANDSSVTRSFSMFLKIFALAGLKVTSRLKQTRFPKDLYPVWSFALKPKTLSDQS